jgi:hypothetical protein
MELYELAEALRAERRAHEATKRHLLLAQEAVSVAAARWLVAAETIKQIKAKIG